MRALWRAIALGLAQPAALHVEALGALPEAPLEPAAPVKAFRVQVHQPSLRVARTALSSLSHALRSKLRSNGLPSLTTTVTFAPPLSRPSLIGLTFMSSTSYSAIRTS